jgi:anion-transporting  ArsA/GET3 family ATPase
MPDSPLSTLLLERRVVVVAGAGGVGKTTIAAALSLAAAESGRRVLCLTIDPAKRLFDRLGLDPSSDAEQRVDPASFRAAGLSLGGELTVVMLDTKRTFDDLVRRHASSPAAAERILNNEFYEYVSTQLSGTQAYMAMEKVLSVLGDQRYDLLVLDTPPTADALDFLDAPGRLIETLDSPALRWLGDVFERSGRLSLNLVAQGVAFVLRTLARLTGRGFLERLSEFVSELNQLFGGFRERAERVAAAFRRPEFAYLVAASPAPGALDEAAFFVERLTRLGLRASGLIINRVRPGGGTKPALADLERELARRLPSSSADLAARVLLAQDEEIALGALDRKAVEGRRAGQFGPERVPWVVEVPAFADTIHDIAALIAVGRSLGLIPGGASSGSAP